MCESYALPCLFMGHIYIYMELDALAHDFVNNFHAMLTNLNCFS